MPIEKRSETRDKARALAAFSQHSGTNTAQTCSTDAERAYRVLLVTVKVSGAVGADKACTATINSALGGLYDTQVGTVTVVNGGTMIAWQPTRPVDLMKGDVLDFLAPAMGAGLASYVIIYAEEL